MNDQLPVTIVGGYLGAGKTTYVNRLLAEPHGERIAVFVNDFGEVNIDAALITSDDGTTIELTNGCACCAVGDNLAEAFAAALSTRPAFDRIVVEASGVADPRRLAAWASLPGLRLAEVVVLADATSIIERARDRYVGPTVLRQLHAADRIEITKTDLVDGGREAEVRRWLAAMAPEASIESEPPDHPFTSWFIPYDVAVSIDRLRADLTSVTNLARAKGVVQVEGRGRCLVQVVGTGISIEPTVATPARLGLVVIVTREAEGSATACAL